MFGFKRRNPHNRRPKNVRARDGHIRLTGSERRRLCKRSGLSKKQHTRIVKENRAYKKGRPSYRGREF